MHDVQQASMVYFDFSGRVEVEITFPKFYTVYQGRGCWRRDASCAPRTTAWRSTAAAGIITAAQVTSLCEIWYSGPMWPILWWSARTGTTGMREIYWRIFSLRILTCWSIMSFSPAAWAWWQSIPEIKIWCGRWPTAISGLNPLNTERSWISVEDIEIRDFYRDGRKAESLEQAGITVGEFAGNVRLKWRRTQAAVCL